MIYLELSKTRLAIEDDELRQLNSDGRHVLRIPLAEVKDLRFCKTIEPLGLGFLTIALLVWCVGYFVCENDILKSLIYISAVLLGGFGLLGIYSDRILVGTQRGNLLLNCPDRADEGQGFVVSANIYLQRWRQQAAEIKDQPAEAISAGQPVPSV